MMLYFGELSKLKTKKVSFLRLSSFVGFMRIDVGEIVLNFWVLIMMVTHMWDFENPLFGGERKIVTFC